MFGVGNPGPGMQAQVVRAIATAAGGSSLNYGVPLTGLTSDGEYAVGSGVWYELYGAGESLSNPDSSFLMGYEAGSRDGNPWTMSSPGDVTTSSAGTTGYGPSGRNVHGLRFTNSGLNMIAIENSTSPYATWSNTCSSAYDITTRGSWVAGDDAGTIIPTLDNVKGWALSDDGTKGFIYTDATNGSVFDFTLSTPYDLTTMVDSSAIKANLWPDTGGAAFGITTTPDGKYFIIARTYSSSNIRVYEMSTPWEASTGTLITTITMSDVQAALTSDIRGISVDVYLKKFYVISDSDDKLYGFDWTG